MLRFHERREEKKINANKESKANAKLSPLSPKINLVSVCFWKFVDPSLMLTKKKKKNREEKKQGS